MIFNNFYYDDMKRVYSPQCSQTYCTHVSSQRKSDIFAPLPHHCCENKTRGGKRKAILYRNGEICICGGSFHPGRLNTWKVQPSVQNTRYMSFVEPKLKFLHRSKGNYVYNFETKKYVHLRETPLRYSYERYVQSKNIYLNSGNVSSISRLHEQEQ